MVSVLVVITGKSIDSLMEGKFILWEKLMTYCVSIAKISWHTGGYSLAIEPEAPARSVFLTWFLALFMYVANEAEMFDVVQLFFWQRFLNNFLLYHLTVATE